MDTLWASLLLLGPHFQVQNQRTVSGGLLRMYFLGVGYSLYIYGQPMTVHICVRINVFLNIHIHVRTCILICMHTLFSIKGWF